MFVMTAYQFVSPLSFCVLFSLLQKVWLSESKNSFDVEKELRKGGVIPDVIQVAPKHVLEVKFRSEAVEFGNTLKARLLFDPPSEIKWPTEKDAFYTLVYTDPDVPSRERPEDREWQHWLVVNIPGTRLELAKTLSEYTGAVTFHLNSFHRYVFVVFKQKEKQTFDMPYLDRRPLASDRAKFSTVDFAKAYDLGDPIAANYFLCGNETVL